jgi:lipopolysaccharide biosynthesis glycosyltransferase
MIDTIVILTYKQGYFLSRLCISSIRYFYPDIDIWLVRDYLNGHFDTRELEQAFNVRILDLGIEKFGWSAAKVHLMFAEQFRGRKVLSLDNDIIFAGRFLEKLSASAADCDFVVNPDYQPDPRAEAVKRHYYDYDKVMEFDPSFRYPGYVFNGGQMVITPGTLDRQQLKPLFDLDAFPYYNKLDVFYQYDQSLLNYFLPRQDQDGAIRLGTFPMMLWSDAEETKALSLQRLKEGSDYQCLIHYAGVTRVSDLSRMTRPDILLFFEDYYYQHVPNGRMVKRLRRTAAKIDFRLRHIYRKLRSFIK